MYNSTSTTLPEFDTVMKIMDGSSLLDERVNRHHTIQSFVVRLENGDGKLRLKVDWRLGIYAATEESVYHVLDLATVRSPSTISRYRGYLLSM